VAPRIQEESVAELDLALDGLEIDSDREDAEEVEQNGNEPKMGRGRPVIGSKPRVCKLTGYLSTDVDPTVNFTSTDLATPIKWRSHDRCNDFQSL
jgi:hypothetical protein